MEASWTETFDDRKVYTDNPTAVIANTDGKMVDSLAPLSYRVITNGNDMNEISSSRQIENRNFLSPTGFRFSLRRSPKVAFFCNQANIPAMTLGVTEQATYLKNIPVPGDKIEFGDLTLRFLVDEDLKNYMEIQNWIRGLGYPDSLNEFDDWIKQEKFLVDMLETRIKFILMELLVY